MSVETLFTVAAGAAPALVVAGAAGIACVRARSKTPVIAMLPFAAGAFAGLCLLAGWAVTLAYGDRFYDAGAARLIVAALAASLCGRLLVAAWRGAVGSTAARALAEVAVDIASATAVVGAGVRFSILAAGTGPAVWLGPWAAPLTVFYIVAATWAVRLLDGLHGVAPALLLVASTAIGISASVNGEPVLGAIAGVAAGAVLGSLWLHLPPARLPARGAATSMFGFFFAVLTVMARQKSVVAGVVILPLVLAVLAVAAVMLGALERNLFGGEEPQRKDATAERREDQT